MSDRAVTVRAIVATGSGRVAIKVEPPRGIDLQYIYRAAQSVYWDPISSQLEDRSEGQESPVASARRICEALLGEYRLALQPAPDIAWQGIEPRVQREMRRVLGW
jgi:hypothetical protein